MWDIGCMVWRIGKIIDFYEQIDWIEKSGFDSVSFHAHAGEPGVWEGMDPQRMSCHDIERLKHRLSMFSRHEVHAPFGYTITQAKGDNSINNLKPVFNFCKEIGASIVTIHSEVPEFNDKTGLDTWIRQINEIDNIAHDLGIKIGLEITCGFEILDLVKAQNTFITLDIGHTYLDNGIYIEKYGSIGNLIKSVGDKIAHIHIHDYDGIHDHIELGTGIIDFNDVFLSLHKIKYEGMLCLEIDPDWVEPDGIIRSADFIRHMA